MNSNKMADNLFYDKRKDINNLDDQIYDNKRKIKELVKIQESLIALDFNINDCINILSKSMKGNNDESLYSEMQETNRKNLFNSLDIIEKNVDSLKKNIDNLKAKKDEKLKKQEDSEIEDNEKNNDKYIKVYYNLNDDKK